MKPIGSGHKRRPLVADLDRRPRHIIAHCGLEWDPRRRDRPLAPL
jgi:hypothetical protein